MERINKTRKSVALTKDEWKGLKKYRSGFITSIECAAAIGIERGPLDRILLIGTGSEASINVIRRMLAGEANLLSENP